jgi:hypothetical protein
MAKESQDQVNQSPLHSLQKKTPHQIEFLRRSWQPARKLIAAAKKENLNQTKFSFRNSARTLT